MVGYTGAQCELSLAASPLLMCACVTLGCVLLACAVLCWDYAVRSVKSSDSKQEMPIPIMMNISDALSHSCNSRDNIRHCADARP